MHDANTLATRSIYSQKYYQARYKNFRKNYKKATTESGKH